MAFNNIIMNRGDTYSFDLSINDESSETGYYKLQGDDAVYFGIMDPNQPFEDALVKKKYTADPDGLLEDQLDFITITINPEDTLDLYPGKYYYAVKLHMNHDEEDGEGNIIHIDEVQTVIQKTRFIICD